MRPIDVVLVETRAAVLTGTLMVNALRSSDDCSVPIWSSTDYMRRRLGNMRPRSVALVVGTCGRWWLVVVDGVMGWVWDENIVAAESASVA